MTTTPTQQEAFDSYMDSDSPLWRNDPCSVVVNMRRATFFAGYAAAIASHPDAPVSAEVDPRDLPAELVSMLRRLHNIQRARGSTIDSVICDASNMLMDLAASAPTPVEAAGREGDWMTEESGVHSTDFASRSSNQFALAFNTDGRVLYSVLSGDTKSHGVAIVNEAPTREFVEAIKTWASAEFSTPADEAAKGEAVAFAIQTPFGISPFGWMDMKRREGLLNIATLGDGCTLIYAYTAAAIRVASAEAVQAAYEDAARYRFVRKGLSDFHGDCYAMTFAPDGDYPVSGDVLDCAIDNAIRNRARAGGG